MKTSSRLVAVAIVLVISYGGLSYAYGTGSPPPSCAKWRYDEEQSTWKYKCDGGRLLLREDELSLIDWKTKQPARVQAEIESELECTCDDEGATFGYVCPGSNDCPYHYSIRQFHLWDAVVKKKSYGHEYQTTGFGQLLQRIYPDGIKIPDVAARQIEKGRCSLQCGYAHERCGSKCPQGQEPSGWVCQSSRRYSKEEQIFSLQEHKSLKESLTYGHVEYISGDRTVTIEHNGVLSKIDVATANAVAGGSCTPTCEAPIRGRCQVGACKEEGISHFACGKDKVSVPHFKRVAEVFGRFKARKIFQTEKHSLFELYGTDHEEAILVDGTLLESLSNGDCEAVCNEPMIDSCENGCSESAATEYVCKVEGYHTSRPHGVGRHKKNSGINQYFKDTNQPAAYHHIGVNEFKKLYESVQSRNCRFTHRADSSSSSYYSCQGGKQKIPADLFIAIKKGKCRYECIQEVECEASKKCDVLGPTICKSGAGDVQIPPEYAEYLSQSVAKGLCSKAIQLEYARHGSQQWICPGGFYIDQDTYQGLLYGTCTSTCLEDIQCKCGDIQPAVSIFSGALPIQNGKPVAGDLAEFVVSSTHPLIPLTDKCFDIKGPSHYDISVTPSHEPTIQYLNIELSKPYNGPVSLSLTKYAHSKAGEMICNIDQGTMEYYIKKTPAPITYEGTWIESKENLWVENSTFFDEAEEYQNGEEPSTQEISPFSTPNYVDAVLKSVL